MVVVVVVLLYRDHLTTQINPAVEAAGEHPENNYNLTEPMFLVKTWMFLRQKKVWSLKVFIGIIVDACKNALNSILSSREQIFSASFILFP